MDWSREEYEAGFSESVDDLLHAMDEDDLREGRKCLPMGRIAESDDLDFESFEAPVEQQVERAQGLQDWQERIAEVCS